MPQNRIWELIARKLSGEANENELAELETLLREDPELHYPLQAIADLWHQPLPPSTPDAHRAYDAHLKRMQDMGMEDINNNGVADGTIPSSNPRRKIFLSLTGILGLLALSFWLYSVFSPGHRPPVNKTVADKSEITTRNGSRTKLQLPDGSQVWMNSGSKLVYDKSFGNNLREVTLAGEAFFDVVKNPNLAFVIHTSTIDIRVLGTAFNVKSFPGEKNTETSLIRGSIEVTFHNRPSVKIILKPNEKLVTANEDTIGQLQRKLIAENKAKAALDKTAHVEPNEPMVMMSHLTYQPKDSTILETSWMENKLMFRSERFDELAVQMERWYGVNIRFTNEGLKSKKLTGIFENETIQQALAALHLITPFNYRISKTDVLITPR
ncbi:MAG TPA: FecR domain-containing protein [Mucilaginibacter sp.]|nr:FecR domain-containing protein [Mucilaginibacter sp.]